MAAILRTRNPPQKKTAHPHAEKGLGKNPQKKNSNRPRLHAPRPFGGYFTGHFGQLFHLSVKTVPFRLESPVEEGEIKPKPTLSFRLGFWWVWYDDKNPTPTKTWKKNRHQNGMLTVFWSIFGMWFFFKKPTSQTSHLGWWHVLPPADLQWICFNSV